LKIPLFFFGGEIFKGKFCVSCKMEKKSLSMERSFRLNKSDSKKWEKRKKRCKIEAKRVSKAENFIEGEGFFSNCDQLDLQKMGQQILLIRW
jgi:hypothetical protein